MQEELIELGLSKNEAIVYLKLSEIGLSSAYAVAKHSRLFKANAYDAIKRLVEKGLVSKKNVNGKTMYEAADPTALVDMIEAKKEKVTSILPSIRLMQEMTTTESVFNVYKGVDSYVRLLYHLLDFNESILIYGAPKLGYELMKHRIGHFHKERIKRKIKQIHIYNMDAIERIKKIKGMPFTPIKCLPQSYESQVTTTICGDEVIFVIWLPPVKVIQIKDKDMSIAYKKYFQLLWKQAKKVA